MAFWWVNQNQTLRDEIEGGFIWSPKQNKNGGFNRFYENMKLVEPGDIILSFADQRIGHVGFATDRAVTNPKPDFGGKGENWNQEGWLVPVAWTKLTVPIRPKTLIDQLRPTLPTKYAPVPVGNSGPDILMVQPAQYWYGQGLTDGLDGAGDRRVLLQ
jgi:putative restriction endonuclease